MTGMRWGAYLNVVAGALLVIAPFALGYYTLSSIAMSEAVVAGLLIAAVALWSAVGTAAPAYLDYVVALLGGWSILAPFVLGYHEAVQVARNTDVFFGIAVVLFALAGHFYVSSPALPGRPSFSTSAPVHRLRRLKVPFQVRERLTVLDNGVRQRDVGGERK